MGKTIQEIEWARHVNEKTGLPILIFAPLAVGSQMVKEGKLVDMDVRLARSQADVKSSIAVTNYEMMGHFDPSAVPPQARGNPLSITRLVTPPKVYPRACGGTQKSLQAHQRL